MSNPQGCSSSCPLCYANIRGRSNYKNHRGYIKPHKWRWFPLASYVRPPSPDGKGDGAINLWPDSAFVRDYPALAEFMSMDRWDDGTAREPTTLLLFASDGRLKACVNDKACNRVAFITGVDLQEVLRLIECGLETNTLDWRGHRPGGAGGPRRK